MRSARVCFRSWSTSLIAIVALSAATAGHAQALDPSSAAAGVSAAPGAASDIVVTGRYSGFTSNVTDTALKLPIAIKDAPQAISVVTQELLTDTGSRRLIDLVPYIAGVSASYTTGGADNLTIRGQRVDADNGFRIDGAAFYEVFTPDASTIDTVEVLKGPVATLYGRGPGNGAINYVSKKPLSYSFSEIRG